jgi:hypothetical protein
VHTGLGAMPSVRVFDRVCNRQRNRSYVLDELDDYIDTEFTRMFRLARPVYYSLLSKI